MLTMKARNGRTGKVILPYPARKAHAPEGLVARAAEFLHHRLLVLLLASYALAALLPGPGLWLREVSFGTLTLGGEGTRLTLPMALLALLLFNAGVGVHAAQLRQLLRTPGALLAGLAANLFVPVLYILALSWGLYGWVEPAGLQQVLIGLTLVASMPVAGSSAAWSQNANGNLALSLGLVLGSTFLSPLSTPAVLALVGSLARDLQADALAALTASGTGAFLALFVLLPSVVGLLTRRLVGEGPAARAKPALKLLNSVVLLVLNYANAAVSLPAVVAAPDWGFLTVALVVVLGLCVGAFASGWVVARLLGAPDDQRTALMFGLGMNNNGTGLVLASVVLGHLPAVMLPLILYTLVQHIVAGCANYLTRRPPAAPEAQPVSVLSLRTSQLPAVLGASRLAS
jgi:BASS family bile acid:Na+ symporter